MVFLVDPDPEMRELVERVASTMCLPCQSYTSAAEFLSEYAPRRHGCVVLELRIPGATGLDLQQTLASQHPSPPVVFLTAYGTISTAVHAMRAGALHFLEKPVRDNELWEAISHALAVDRERRAAWHQQREALDTLESLTERERQVLSMLAQGKSKRTMAKEIQGCVRTVELHQSRMRKKLGLESSFELLHFALKTEAFETLSNGNGRLDGAQSLNSRTSSANWLASAR